MTVISFHRKVYEKVVHRSYGPVDNRALSSESYLPFHIPWKKNLKLSLANNCVDLGVGVVYIERTSIFYLFKLQTFSFSLIIIRLLFSIHVFY